MNSIFITARRIAYSVAALISKLLGEKNKGVILCYHSISDDKWNFSLSKDDFIKQIDFLLKSYQPISVEELELFYQKKLAFDKPFMLLTFDDGYRNILEIADFLNEKEIKPIVFVITNPERSNKQEMDNNYELLTTADMNYLKSIGWTIGCHSATHRNFKYLNDKELSEEIYKAKKQLEQNLGQTVNYFAYPKGWYDNKIKDAVISSGFRLAFSMDSKLINYENDTFAIPRVGVMSTHTFSEFRSMILPFSTKIRSIYFDRAINN